MVMACFLVGFSLGKEPTDVWINKEKIAGKSFDIPDAATWL
jgi:hypothetical protein